MTNHLWRVHIFRRSGQDNLINLIKWWLNCLIRVQEFEPLVIGVSPRVKWYTYMHKYVIKAIKEGQFFFFFFQPKKKGPEDFLSCLKPVLDSLSNNN